MATKNGALADSLLNTTTLARRGNLLILHGEKGGVQKSATATVAASRAIYRGLSINVIETDGGIVDVGPRFNKIQGAKVGFLPFSDDDEEGNENIKAGDLLTSLLDYIETEKNSNNPPDLFVVNTPAGAARVLDKFGAVFGDVATGLDMDLTVGFMVDNTPAAIPSLLKSLNSGLLKYATRPAVIYTGGNGPKKNFPVYEDKEVQKALKAAGVHEKDMPALPSDALKTLIKKIEIPYYDLLGPGHLSFSNRSLFGGWLASTEPLADWLIGGNNG